MRVAIGLQLGLQVRVCLPEGAVFQQQGADVLSGSVEHPDLVPKMVQTKDGCLVARQAAYTVEHLVKDLSTEPVHPNVPGLLESFVTWVQKIITYSSAHGIKLDDGMPRNIGYDPVEFCWRAIDAGCFKIALGARTPKSVWTGLRKGLGRFHEKFSGVEGFLDLLDSVIPRFVQSSNPLVTPGEHQAVSVALRSRTSR